MLRYTLSKNVLQTKRKPNKYWETKENQKTFIDGVARSIKIKENDNKTPEKLGVKFRIPEEILQDSTEYAKLVKEIKQYLEKEIFTWGSFPINLPHSKFSNSAYSETISLQDLFKKPDLNELPHIARAPNGKLKTLTEKQFREIQEDGKFSVPSVSFQGRNHVITLSWLLQKGRNVIAQIHRNTVAVSLKQLLIEVPDRILSPNPISIRNGLKWIWRGLRDIPDLIFGLPAFVPRYGQHEINVEVEDQMFGFMKSELQEIRSDLYKTPEGVEIDFSVWEKFLEDTTQKRLQVIQSNVHKEWVRDQYQFRVNLVRRLKSEEIPEQEIIKRVADEAVLEENRRLLEAVRNDRELSFIHPSLPQFTERYFRFYLIWEEVEQQISHRHAKKREEIAEQLKLEYQTRSLIKPWMERNIEKLMTPYLKENDRKYCLEQVISKLSHEQDLQEFLYFLNKELQFRTTEEPKIRENMSAKKKPAKEYHFRRIIWNPKNWIIHSEEKNRNGDTVLNYYAQKDTKYTITSKWPGWRFTSMAVRIWTWWNNGFYWIFFVNLLNGPLSLRALFSPWAFYPSSIVNSRTGEIEKCLQPKVESFLSRLRACWQNVLKSRANFEAKRDDGILGKSITRIFNVVWNYIVKGLVGTTLIIIGFPVLAIANITLSTVFLVLSPLWAPLLSVIWWAWSILLYDNDCTSNDLRAFPIIRTIIKLGILGIAQIVVSFIFAVVIHPVSAAVVVSFAWVRTVVRQMYDWVIFRLILKRSARVPASDSFLARRTSGPGLKMGWVYQVSTEVALLALQLHMEKEELCHYESSVTRLLSSSMETYKKIHSQVFGLFGALVDPRHEVYNAILERNETIRKNLEAAIKEHHSKINIKGLAHDLKNVQQTASALAHTLEKGTSLVKEFYPSHIMKSMSQEDIEQFWGRLDLAPNDWNGLTQVLFSRIFPGSFLKPIEDDESFALKVDHIGLSNYVNMLFEANPHDDLDEVYVETVRRTESYTSTLPRLDLLVNWGERIRVLSCTVVFFQRYQILKDRY